MERYLKKTAYFILSGIQLSYVHKSVSLPSIEQNTIS